MESGRSFNFNLKLQKQPNSYYAPRKCLLMKRRLLSSQHGCVWGEQEGGGQLCSWFSWTCKGESRLRSVLIQMKSNRKVNIKMNIDLPLNPNIFILGDLDSITNINKDRGHFILRASLIGKKLILQKWKSAK